MNESLLLNAITRITKEKKYIRYKTATLFIKTKTYLFLKTNLTIERMSNKTLNSLKHEKVHKENLEANQFHS